MDVYGFVLFLHVLAAVALIGGSLVGAPLTRAAARRARTTSDLHTWAAFNGTVTKFDPLSAVTLLGTGVFLASAGSWWGAPWVYVAVVLWLVDGIVAGAVVKPALTRLVEATRGGGSDPVDDETDHLRRSGRWTIGPDIVLANDIGVLFLMLAKTDYWESVAAVVAAHIVIHGTRVGWRSFREGTRDRVGALANTAH